MKRKPGFPTVLFLLLMLGGKLAYAATLPVFMDIEHNTPQQMQGHCHDGDAACEGNMALDHDHGSSDCAKSCLASCASHAVPTVAQLDLNFQKPGVEFSYTTSRPSRRLEALYRPPQA